MEVYGHWVERRLDHLPSAATLKPVTPTIPDWIDTHSIVPTTKRNYKSEIKRFCDVVGADLPVQDIPRALKHYKKHCIKRGTERTFNAARTTILAYLNNNFGKSHTLYQKVSDIPTLSAAPKRRAPQLPVVEAIALIQELPPLHADIARAMLFTGMHWKEIEGNWSVKTDRVVIKGTKAKGRQRFVPLIDPDILRPQRASKAFRTQLKKVRPDVSPYSFRRSYAHWMEEAGIPRIRRRMYLGHGDADVTDRYERPDIERFLKDDAEALRTYIFKSWRERGVENEEEQTTPIFLFKSKKK